MNENKKEIVSYLNSNDYAILIPIYYECEEKPALRKVFVGTQEECKKIFNSYPDSMQATYEENKNNRKWKLEEYLLLMSLKNIKKAMEMKRQYGF